MTRHDHNASNANASKSSEVTGVASAVERLRPGWAGTTLTGRYNEVRVAANEKMGDVDHESTALGGWALEPITIAVPSGIDLFQDSISNGLVDHDAHQPA